MVTKTDEFTFGWQFPMELEESALRLAHNTYATVNELVERIYAAHRPGKENAEEAASPPPNKPKHPMPRPLIRNWLFEVQKCNSRDSSTKASEHKT